MSPSVDIRNSWASRSSSPDEATHPASGPPRKQPRRTRASNAKVKTGCLTCKRRHKKCDEARPSCMTCTTKGYKCDGYLPAISRKGADASKDPAQHQRYDESPARMEPSPLPTFAPEEQRFFDIFCKYTIPQLAGGFESSFWQTFIPRASYQVPCIRHAAIALAALHEDFAQGRKVITDAQPSSSDSDFTMAQYGLAIKCLLRLVKEAGDGSTEMVLSVCILFICFELLRGNYNAVLLHTQSGMNVLTDTMSKLTPKSDSKSSMIPLASIAPVFTRIDVQASDILDAAPPGRFGKLTTPLTPSPIPHGFCSLEESKQYLLEYQNYFMFKVREVVNVHGADAANWPRLNRERLLRMRKEYLDVIKAWHQLHLELTQQHNFDEDVQAGRASNVLLIHRDFLAIALSRFPSQDETDFDQYSSEFEEIVRFARGVLESTVTEQVESLLTLSFDIGIAEPLFYVVSRCRSPRLRRDALELLEKCPTNEGIWNSSLAARIGEKIISIEERASPAWPHVQSEADVPRSARILHAAPKLTKRTGDLVISFYDMYNNLREERVDWAGPATDKLLAVKSRANWALGSYQRSVKSRLRLNVNTVPQTNKSDPSSNHPFIASRSPSPPVDPILVGDGHLPLRPASSSSRTHVSGNAFPSFSTNALSHGSCFSSQTR